MAMKWEDTGYKADIARAKGLGSARAGLEDWIKARVSAIAIGVLTLWFGWFFTQSLGASHEEFTALLAKPYHAVPMILLAWALMLHARLGCKEIVEDYIQNKGFKLFKLIGIYFFYVACAAISIVSVLKIFFTVGV